MMNLPTSLLVLTLVAAAGVVGTAAADDTAYFAIHVVDGETGAGVPLISLTLTNSKVYWSDSGGYVAFFEPGLMDVAVHFEIGGDGYTFPKDGFGYSGVTLVTASGGEATITVNRTLAAERLYRFTGQGIYRDAFLLGKGYPIADPTIDSDVMGLDSTQHAIYKGKVRWFWGDTLRPSYPLGNFATTGATSDPSIGLTNNVNLTYWGNGQGFVKAMLPINVPKNGGPVWIAGVTTDASGDAMYCVFSKNGPAAGDVADFSFASWGVAKWNDTANQFAVASYFKNTTSPMFTSMTGSQATLYNDSGTTFVLHTNAYPLMRVRATDEAITDQGSYEAYTCLKQNSTFANPEVDRDSSGQLVYSWKTNTPPVTEDEQVALQQAGVLHPGEGLINLTDSVKLTRSALEWNEYLKQWVLIGQAINTNQPGYSFLGEIYFAAADKVEGPYRKATKVVTHKAYTFYNPIQFRFAQEGGGRFIYFAATYTAAFTNGVTLTPRYNYNNVMYRLDVTKG